jgi:hypothetical protein
MRLKIVLGFMVIGLLLIAFVPGALGVKPDIPSVPEAIADLQTSVSALWTNATEQQSEIRALQDQPSVHFGIPNATAPDGGSWLPSVVYQADTDGFVIVHASSLSENEFGYISVRAFPVLGPEYEERTSIHYPGSSITMPIPKGATWMVSAFETTDCSIIWLPITT